MTETAKEYATALFELAKESASEKEIGDALAMLLSEISENPEYEELLSSPNISLRERRTLLEEAFADRVPEYALSFTELLCEKGKIRELGSCVREYQAMYQALQSLSHAKVVSAVPLTESEKTALIKKLEKISGHSVSAQYETDESLLGGLVVYMDGNVLDGSLKNQLKEVKEVIGI